MKNEAIRLAGLWLSLSASVALAQGPAVSSPPRPLQIDASAAFVPAGPPDYVGGTNRAPDGDVLGVTDRYLTLKAKPWIPVMGELHFSRVPEAEWEDEILKMKSAGVTVISTYMFWIHHEEVQGVWDWTGQRDLRHFAELCEKHHMLLYMRIGPWAHGEARNGGLPDWVVQGGPVRQMDPKFMAETGTLYQQIGKQLQGMLWKDGGPVIGVQIENEYSARGLNKGEAYILALKKLAVESGLDVPLYSVTGWDRAVVPKGQFLPVYGGYPAAPWGSSRTALPPQEVYAFRFHSRVSGNMGMIGSAGTPEQSSAPAPARTPSLTAEVGGGIEDTYHRRPVLSADDIAAMMPVMLGSGVNGYGTYMFHGGENPNGKLTTLQESQATHYPTDVPVKSYDFQAPIGQFGLERESLRLMKDWNYFLNDFGDLLAPMPAFAPVIVPKSPDDLGPLRWSVRTDGKSGFVFVNNYVREAAMPAHPHTQFAIALPGGRTQLMPDTPIDIPAGAYFAWPFSLDLSGVTVRYATAQLMARLDDRSEGSDEPTYLFTCLRGLRCELVLETPRADVTASPGVSISERDGAVVIAGTEASEGQHALMPVRVKNQNGATVSFLLLTAAEADDAWKAELAGKQEVLFTSADVFAEEAGVTMQQLDNPVFQFTIYPAQEHAPPSSAPLRNAGADYTVTLTRLTPTVEVTQQRQAGTVPPGTLGPALSWRPTGVAQAPGDPVWAADAAAWQLRFTPRELPPGVSNLFLKVMYTGDEARLNGDGMLLDDNFFNGEPWLVGLKRYASGGILPPMQLQILPMRGDSPIFLAGAARSRIGNGGQTIAFDGARLQPQYQVSIGDPSGKGSRSTSRRGSQ
jgi:beta-galactosidase